MVPPPEDTPLDESRYLIERIVRAEPRGRGWVVHVKWQDYDEVTAEPVSAIVRDTRGDPDILRQINEAQLAYRDEHPVRVSAAGDDLPRPEQAVPVPNTTLPDVPDARLVPTRVLPARRARPTQFHLEHVIAPAYRQIAHVYAMRARACRLLANVP